MPSNGKGKGNRKSETDGSSDGVRLRSAVRAAAPEGAVLEKLLTQVDDQTSGSGVGISILRAGFGGMICAAFVSLVLGPVIGIIVGGMAFSLVGLVQYIYMNPSKSTEEERT